MEHKMHKPERKLSPEATLAVLKRGDHGTLSVNGDDGYPYATPVNYIVVDDQVYIHSAHYGYKMECLARDKKCCFSAIVHAEIIPSKITAAFESVVITGKIVMIEDEALKRKVLEAFVTEKHPGYEETGFKMIDAILHKTAILQVEPQEMTGKAYLG